MVKIANITIIQCQVCSYYKFSAFESRSSVTITDLGPGRVTHGISTWWGDLDHVIFLSVFRS